LLALLGCLGRLRWPSRRDLPSLLAIGVLQLSGFFALCHLAVSLVPAGRTAILSNAAIVWVVPFTALIGEAVPRQRWLAAGLGLLGIVTLSGPWAIDWRQGPLVLGHALLLLAALVWAATIIITRLRPPALPALEILPWAFALSTVLLVGLALWREPQGGVGPGAWPHALFNGVIVAPIGTWCLVELARRLAPMVSSVLLLIIPATGVLISAWALGERISADLVLGGGLIAAGVALAAATPTGRPA
jgi:drug/metabolite transporter (DMT)-like permease